MAKKKAPHHSMSAHSEHWEKHYSPSTGNDDKSGIRAFDPRSGKDRPHTQHKINELDH